MKIQTNKNKLDISDLHEILIAHASDAQRKLKLKRYFIGKHDAILQKPERANDAPNNRLISNFPAYISTMSTGFFIGQPVVYKSATENEDEVKILSEIFKYNDEAAHNLELAEESSITGEAFELLYTDSDAQIRFTAVPSEEVILVCDSTLEQNVICAIRHFKIYALNQTTYTEFVDVYDEKEVRHYEYNSSLKFLGSEPHYFDDVPIVEYPNNKQRRGDFEDVLSLVDAYNLAQSLSLDDLSDFTDAFLILKGMGGTNGDDVKELRRNKVIPLDDGGAAEWLIKNLNDTYVENMKNRLQTDIHKFSNIPDMSDSNFAGNASGVAIKYKLIGLEQIRSRKEREFKKALQRRIELIAGILKLKNQTQIDFRDIEIVFTANIPANLQEMAQIVTTLDGMISQKTLLSLLPFVTDPLEEISEIQREKDEEFSAVDKNNFPNLTEEHDHDEQQNLLGTATT